MSSLDPRLLQILRPIVSAYRVEADGQREPLMHLRMADAEFFQHRGWPESAPPVSRNDLEDLAELKLVRIEDTGRSWLVAPTHRGIAIADRHDYDEALPPSNVRLDWEHVRPVLSGIVACWEHTGGGRFDSVALPEIVDALGPHVDPVFVQRAVGMLEEDGWVECEHEMGTPYPLGVRPLAKALSVTRDWPSADGAAAAQHLTTVLEQLIAGEPDEGKRRKLGMIRDLLLELGARTASELAGKLIGV
jgi:hypothetical protein